MSKPIPPRYKTTNWTEYNAALKRRGLLTIWFDSEMVGSCTILQTWWSGGLQRCRHSGMSDAEGGIRDGTAADDAVRDEPSGTGRS